MFAAETDRRSLRQGDILAAVPAPLLRALGISFVSRVAPERHEAPATHTGGACEDSGGPATTCEP
jgi:hypothetical protein